MSVFPAGGFYVDPRSADEWVLRAGAIDAPDQTGITLDVGTAPVTLVHPHQGDTRRGTRRIYDRTLCPHTANFLAIAGAIVDGLDYRGSVEAGIALVHLEGAVVADAFETSREQWPYRKDRYLRACSSGVAEIEAGPSASRCGYAIRSSRRSPSTHASE